MSNKITVGQVLYKENTFKGEITIDEVTVAKVGKKYLYLEGYLGRFPVDIETLEHINKEFSQSNFQLYTDKQQVLDKIERNALWSKVGRYLYGRDNFKEVSLEQLRQIAEILKIK
jgi:hypothetical protein